MDGLDSLGYATFVVSLLFLVLATIAVGARLCTRRMLKSHLGADDWLIIAALFMYYVFTGVEILTIFTLGGGQNPLLAVSKLSTYLEAEYFIGPIYILAITFVKFSVICLYRRIFSVPAFRRVSLWVGVFCLLWAITGFVGGLLYCIPAKSFWTMAPDRKCFNYDNWFLSMEILDLLADAVIICLPLRMIADLHLSLEKKITLAGIFLLGGFVCVTGAIRIALVYQPNSVFISFTKASLWSAIQLGTAVICACLPTYRPLLSSLGNTVRHTYASFLRTTGAQSTTGGKSTPASTVQSGLSHYKRMDDSDGHHIHLTAVSGGSQYNKAFSDIEAQGITVRHDVRVH